MGKKARSRTREQSVEPGEVAPRQPCPCGSGKRYKACHGAPGGGDTPYVARPFEGLPSECDVIAMRDLVPAATARLTLRDSSRPVLLCSVLPGAAPALVRESGEIWLGLQVRHGFGDPSRDLGAVLLKALDAEVGAVGLTSAPGPGPRLQDLVVDQPLEVDVHDGFDYWVADVDDVPPALREAIDQATSGATPTQRLAGVEAAYWTDVGSKEHLRWVMGEPEDRLLDALARLHTAGRDHLVPDGRLVGMFRAYGLLAPVWDLVPGTGPEVLEEPAERFAAALAEALADGSPLSAEERAARSGLANRQVTIR